MEAIQALVVSAETAAGAPPINDDRIARGFPPLEVTSCYTLMAVLRSCMHACSAVSCCAFVVTGLANPMPRH